VSRRTRSVSASTAPGRQPTDRSGRSAVGTRVGRVWGTGQSCSADTGAGTGAPGASDTVWDTVLGTAWGTEGGTD